MEAAFAAQGDKRPINKQATGIDGLDRVLKGGLPIERVSIVRGGPGTGKTVLALEVLARQAQLGIAGVFVSFEETPESVRQNAFASGWDLQRLEDERKLAVLHLNVPPNMVRSGEFSIGATVAIIRQQAQRIGARIIVLDAVDWLLSLFDEAALRTQHLQTLYSTMRELKVTGIITVKEHLRDLALLDYIADCIICLDHRSDDQVTTRRLRVTKYRGSGFLSNEHPYLISPDGVKLLPVSGISLTHAAPLERVSSGNQRLDELLCGGFFRGSCVLISGTSGTGKTTLVCRFAEAACQAGERVLLVTYEESTASLVHAMESPGMNLGPLVESKKLLVMTNLPEAMGVDHHLLQVVQAIDTFAPSHIIVDAISATKRMGSARAAFDLQVRLVYICKDRGITCVFSMQAGRKRSIREIGAFPVASIAECVIALEQDWTPDEFHRKLAIVKSRGSPHSSGVFPFQITSSGIKIADRPADSDTRDQKEKGSDD